MKKFASILTVTVMLALAAPAHSKESQTGSRLGDRLEDGKKMALKDAIKNAHTYARCIYVRRDRTVDRFLTTVDAADYENASKNLFLPVTCDFWAGTSAMTDSLSIYNTPASLRGLLAEAALRQKGHLKPAAEPLAVLPMQDAYNRTWFVMTQRPHSVDAMATCIADTQPQMVRDLLRTDTSSDDEKKQIGVVAGSLGPCLIQGAELKANTFTLRAALAEAYFHRIFGPVDEVIAPQEVMGASE